MLPLHAWIIIIIISMITTVIIAGYNLHMWCHEIARITVRKQTDLNASYVVYACLG